MHKALALSLSPTRTLVTPYCKRIHPPWAQDNTKAAVSPYCSPPFVSRLAPTHLGWDTQRQFTHRSRDPPGSKRRQALLRSVKSMHILHLPLAFFTITVLASHSGYFTSLMTPAL
jgi:hypothetical protein